MAAMSTRWLSRYRYRRTQGFGPAAAARLPAQAWARPVTGTMTITWAEGPTMASGGAGGSRQHICDDQCASPVHGTPLIYSPARDDHACQDITCEYGHGGAPRL